MMRLSIDSPIYNVRGNDPTRSTFKRTIRSIDSFDQTSGGLEDEKDSRMAEPERQIER